jgi:hypothetical protein
MGVASCGQELPNVRIAETVVLEEAVTAFALLMCANAKLAVCRLVSILLAELAEEKKACRQSDAERGN